MPTREDYSHLHMLAIAHYVVALFIGLIGCLPVLHVAVGVAALTGQLPNGPGQVPPDVVGMRVVGGMFVLFGGLAILFSWCIALGLFLAGRCLATYTWHTYALVMAAIACAFFPFGTVLGVFTIMVLVRPSVKDLFEMVANGKQPPLLE
jgi:hypothetical protein